MVLLLSYNVSARVGIPVYNSTHSSGYLAGSLVCLYLKSVECQFLTLRKFVLVPVPLGPWV